MFEFNNIGIKSVEDLQEAMSIQMSWKQWKYQFLGMVERWGLENASQMMSKALCGDVEKNLKPMINFTKIMEK